jgi:hypothetical protein
MALDKSILEMTRVKYSEKWQHEWEQVRSRVQPYTTILTDAPPKGTYWEFPQIGGTEMHEYHGSRKDISFDSLMHGKRGMHHRKFYNAIDISIDEVDDLLNLEYTFEMVKAKQRAAAARFLDMIALGVTKDSSTGKYRVKTEADGGFCGGILGTGYAGEGGTDKTNLDLSYASFKNGTGNLIPVDYATTGTGISDNYAGTVFDRVQYILRRLEEHEAYDGATPGDLCLAISPAVKHLMRSYEISVNRDYGFAAITDGVASYNKNLNATVLCTNMLPTFDTQDKSGATVAGARMCCAWLKSQVGFGMWKQTEFTLKDVNDKVDVDHYIRCKGKAGCARLRDDAVFVLPVLENASA